MHHRRGRIMAPRAVVWVCVGCLSDVQTPPPLTTSVHRYWKKQASQEELLSVANEVQAQAWRDQQAAGVNLIACDGTLYDQMLDTIFMLGIIPKRFQNLGVFRAALSNSRPSHHQCITPDSWNPLQGKSGLDLYFSMARGAEGATALDMSKFMDTNYHYETWRHESVSTINKLGAATSIPRCHLMRTHTSVPILENPAVPELEPGWSCKPDFSHILDKVSRCQATIGKAQAVPMIMGPVSFICLAKSLDGQSVAQSVAKLLPAYRDLLKQLKAKGVSMKAAYA
eukprot:scaffold59611_cov20-Tisochrysis_lutea.AAC.1